MHEMQFAHLPMEKNNWDFLSLPNSEQQPLFELLSKHELFPSVLQERTEDR
ncbi:hypothetical protein JCM19055_2277 [Geomicrobium sp. JCM 19055]|nr:hypothetical protein JCM19055_2277 [Geomicrobium sp. JCM 19055]